MTNDLTIKVTVTYKDGEWIAKSAIYAFCGQGDSPEDALDNFVAEVRAMYSGGKFKTAGEKPLNLAYHITGVTATVLVGVIEETPLTDFGIEVDSVDDDAPCLREGSEVLALPEPEADATRSNYALSCESGLVEMLTASPDATAVIVPYVGGQHICPGDVLWIYEKALHGGRGAYVAKADIVEVRKNLSKAELCSEENFSLHCVDEDEITEANDHILAVFDSKTFREFVLPVPTPQGETAPRGCRYITADYAAKLIKATEPVEPMKPDIPARKEDFITCGDCKRNWACPNVNTATICDEFTPHADVICCGTCYQSEECGNKTHHEPCGKYSPADFPGAAE